MSQQIINIGATANDGTGDVLRESQRKANENFTELYSLVGGSSSFITETFTWTTGAQEFTTSQAIADVALVFLNGQQIDKTTQWTNDTTKVTVIDTLEVGDIVSVMYAVASVGVSESYTKTETDLLLNDKQDTLTAGSGIDITANVISATGAASVNGANVGAVGSGIFRDKTGDTLNFRKLVNAGGVGVAINGDTVELTNQHVNIADMNDTFFGTLAANDLIQYDGGSFVNVQPSTLPISTATQTALNGKSNTGHTHIISDVTNLQTALDGKVNIPLYVTATTTTNVVTTLITIPITLNTSRSVQYHLKGRNPANGNTFAAQCFFSFKNVGGVVSLVGTLSIDRKSDFANGVQTTVTFSAGNANINITPQNGVTTDWELYVEKVY